MKRIVVFFAIILVFAAAIIFLVAKKDKVAGGNTDKISIAASFYPLGEFARKVGGELVDVKVITPAGAEPHDYEPTPQDIVAVRNSKIFLYQGGGLDPWAERLESELESEGVVVVNIGSNFNLSAENGKVDPHIWLDPVMASEEVYVIREALVEADPAHEDIYKTNADKFIKELELLDNKYRQQLSSCVQKDIIVSHGAFGYLGKRYGFNVISVLGISPEEEPSAQKIGELTKIVEEKNIGYVFFETLVSPKLAETIASETGAQTAVLDPIEGIAEEDLKAGENYLSLMENNLDNLKKALQCQSR